MEAKDTSASVIAFSGNTMVYESVKRYALKGLSDLIRVLMESVDDALFELSEKVENDRDRSRYFEAMREIRLKRQSIQEIFDEEMQSCFDQLILNRSQNNRSTHNEELSLVEQDEIEDRLAIDNMISKARPHFEDDLFAVEQRLKTVLHRKQIKQDQNPLDPMAICNSFHNASGMLDTDIQVKLIFYKLFDKYVMANLGRFYQEMNDYFIRKGVLPDFKASQERLKQTSSFMANRINKSQREDDTTTGAEELLEATLNNQSPTSSTHASIPTTEGNVLSLLQGLLSTSGNNAVGIPANSVMQHIAPATNDSAPTGDSVTVQGVNPGYISALTHLQGAQYLTQPVAQVDPQNLQTELQQQLVTFKQEQNAQGNSSDNQIIDVVSMLFDFFFDDEALPDPIKVLMGRLQIPILKIAIMDGGFFNHKKHPARKLLDSISRASLGWSSSQQPEQLLIDKIESIVEFILAEFDEDVVVFEQALDDFKQFLDDEKQRVKQNLEQVEQAEKQKEEKVEQAQRSADELIKKLESKHDFSFEVIDFLEGIWKSVLFNTLLSQSKDSNHWKNLKKISSTLIWTLIPKHTEEEKAKLLKTLPPLLRALSKGMDLIKITTEQQNLVFQMLVLEHANIVKQTSKNIVTRVDDKTIWPEENMAAAFAGYEEMSVTGEEVDLLLTEDETGEMKIVDTAFMDESIVDPVKEVNQTHTGDVIRNLQDFTDCIVKGDIYIDEEIVMDSNEQTIFHQQRDDEADDFLEQAQDLEIGSWVEFKEPGKQALHARLSWKSNVTGKYVFVNRQGHKVKNMTKFGFATELRAGSAKMIESVSVFDRAINSFMSTLKH